MVVTGTHFGFLKEKKILEYFYFILICTNSQMSYVESKDEIFSLSVFENTKKASPNFFMNQKTYICNEVSIQIINID